MAEENRVEKHIGILDGIRAISIFLVVQYHIWLQSWYIPEIKLPYKVLNYLGIYEIQFSSFITRGYVFVEFVILLSALCNFYPYARAVFLDEPWPDTWEFYKKRAIRILPSYYLSLLVSFFLISLPGHYYTDKAFMVKDIVAHLTCTKWLFGDVYTRSQFNGVLWTVQVEIWFYILLPHLAKLFRKRPVITYVIMAVVGFFSTNIIICNATNPGAYENHLLTFAGVYANGMLAAMIYVVWSKRNKENKHSQLLATLVACTCIYCFYYLLKWYGQDMPDAVVKLKQRFLLSVLGVCFILAASSGFRWYQRIFSNKLAMGVCVISYNWYIWHQVIARKLVEWHIPKWEGDVTPNLLWDRPWQIRYHILATVLSIIVAAVVTFGFERPVTRILTKRIGKKQTVKWELPDRWKKTEFPAEKYLPVLAFVLLIVIRLIAFPAIPAGINQDGAMGAVDAKALADYLTDRFGTWLPAHFRAWTYGQMSVLLSYFSVPFIKVLGLNKLSMRLPILIASVFGAYGVYAIMKRYFGKAYGLIAILFLAINPWHFMQSRWALDCNLFPHMFLLGLLFLLRGTEQVKKLYLSMVFFALCMYCYGVSFYMVPFFLLAVCIWLLWKKKVTWKNVGLCLLIYFGIAWPIYGTMLINFMKWETVRLPFVTMSYFEGSVRSGDILFFSEHMGQQFVNNLRSLVNVALWQKDDLIWNTVPGFGTMYKISLPFLLLGFGRCAVGCLKEQEKPRRLACQIIMAYWFFAVCTGLMINGVNVNRINIIFYVHIIFIVIALGTIREHIPGLALAAGVLYGICGLYFFDHYYTDWAKSMESAFFADFTEALETASEYNGEHYCITPDTQFDGATNVTEILTMFVFDVDARYFRGETEEWYGRAIPYQQRFWYTNVSEEDRVYPANTVYIFKEQDAFKFYEEDFCIKRFGAYGVAVPWQIANER